MPLIDAPDPILSASQSGRYLLSPRSSAAERQVGRQRVPRVSAQSVAVGINGFQ